jgi:hypothetical protein
MHLRVIWLAEVWNRLILLEVFQDAGKCVPQVAVNGAIFAKVGAREQGQKTCSSEKVLFDSSNLNALAIDGVAGAEMHSIHGELVLAAFLAWLGLSPSRRRLSVHFI